MDNNQKISTAENLEPYTTTRKIGNCTFIVTTSFSNKGKGDIISRLARLIQNDAEKGT